MTEEDYLKETLLRLQESYQKAAEPIIARLIAIESLKTPKFCWSPGLAAALIAKYSGEIDND